MVPLHFWIFSITFKCTCVSLVSVFRAKTLKLNEFTSKSVSEGPEDVGAKSI